jgi:hypothetical protein
MQVDPPAQGGIPPLPTFLSACVQYKTSPAALRAAVHQYISQPEDLVVVLEALETWVGHWQGAEVIALPTKKNVAKDEHGVSVLKDGWQKDSREAHPPLVDVLSPFHDSFSFLMFCIRYCHSYRPSSTPRSSRYCSTCRHTASSARCSLALSQRFG